MSTDHLSITRRIFDDVFNGGRLDQLPVLAADDLVVRYGANDRVEGLESLRASFTAAHAAFPDEHFTVEDLFGADDRVAVRWRWEATHTGPYQGIEPTGRTVSITGMSVYRLAAGKVVQAWVESDERSLLDQLGATP